MKLHIKVWTSDLKECETFVFPCRLETKAALVRKFTRELEEKFPGNTFRIVPIGGNRYNLIPEPQASA